MPIANKCKNFYFMEINKSNEKHKNKKINQIKNKRNEIKKNIH